MTYDIKCRHCNRFLGNTNKSTVVSIKCSNSKCKKLETYKIVMISDYIKQHEGWHNVRRTKQ